jgi:hypothetical protein
MQPPVAKPAQLTPIGAMMDMSKGKGADVLSGIASLYVRFAPESVKEDMVWAWAPADVASTKLARLRSFMLNINCVFVENACWMGWIWSLAKVGACCQQDLLPLYVPPSFSMLLGIALPHSYRGLKIDPASSLNSATLIQVCLI